MIFNQLSSLHATGITFVIIWYEINLIAFVLFQADQAQGSLVINEIVAGDISGGPDWIEFYVTGHGPVFLGDYTVVDDREDRVPAPLPNITFTADCRMARAKPSLSQFKSIQLFFNKPDMGSSLSFGMHRRMIIGTGPEIRFIY